MSKYSRKFRIKTEPESDTYHSLTSYRIAETVDKDKVSHNTNSSYYLPNPHGNLERTKKPNHKSNLSMTFYDDKPIKTQTEYEYTKRIEALNELERKAFPKVAYEEPQKVEQEANQPVYAEISSTGMLLTAINENVWLNLQIPKNDYIYFKIAVKSRESPLKIIVQKTKAYDLCRDNIKMFVSDTNHRPTSFDYNEVFATKIVKLRTKKHKARFEVEDMFFSIFSESSFAARLRYSFGEETTQVTPNLQIGKSLSNMMLPKIQPNSMTVRATQTIRQSDYDDEELAEEAKDIIGRRKQKIMDLARGSDFLKKNREAAALPIESSLYNKIKLQSQNDLRQRQALRNKRIIEHENTEKRRFLSEKHDLLKSVSYLHRIHEHNQTQNVHKQRAWVEILLIHKFCSIAIERFKNKKIANKKQQMYYFRFALAISRYRRKAKKKGEDVNDRVRNEVFMSLRTHVSHLQASIKDEAKEIIRKFMIDRYKVQKPRAAMWSFYNRMVYVQTRWLAYLRKKHNYKRVLELVWDQYFMQLAVEMQHKKRTRASSVKKLNGRKAVQVESETSKKKKFVEEFSKESFKKFRENFALYRRDFNALDPKLRRMVDYSKYLMNKKTLTENSVLLLKFDNLEHDSINIDDVELVYKKQRSWLYYPESLFFPPRLFVIPSIVELRKYLKALYDANNPSSERIESINLEKPSQDKTVPFKRISPIPSTTLKN